MASDHGKTKKKKDEKKLQKALKRLKGFDRNDTSIPRIVSDPVDWLKSRNALGEEGIFRIPGSAKKIKELKTRYDKGKKVDLNNVDNVHTVAGLIKVFFRELPEPLLTFELYEPFLAAIKPESMSKKLEYIGSVLEALPSGNRMILKYLMGFLREVTEHKSNCMNITNMSIVFAPNLMRSKVESIETILAHTNAINTLMMYFLQFYDCLFLGKAYESQELNGDKKEVDSSILNPIVDDSSAESGEKLKTVMSQASANGENEVKDLTSDEKSVNFVDLPTISGQVVPLLETKISPPSELEGVTKRPCNHHGKDKGDDFMMTLRRGKIKLATNLLEEHDLVLGIQELDCMSPEEREEVTEKMVKKIEENKRLQRESRDIRMLKRKYVTRIGTDESLDSRVVISGTDEEVEQVLEQELGCDDDDDDDDDDDHGEGVPLVPSQEGIGQSGGGDEENGKGVPLIPSQEESGQSGGGNEESGKKVRMRGGRLKRGLDRHEAMKSIPRECRMKSQNVPQIGEKGGVDFVDIVVEESRNGLHDDNDSSSVEPAVESVVNSVLDGGMEQFERFLNDMTRMKRLERRKSKRKIIETMNRRTIHTLHDKI